jgi:hypothetical protein
MTDEKEVDFEEVDEQGNPVVRPPLSREDKLRMAENAQQMFLRARENPLHFHAQR